MKNYKLLVLIVVLLIIALIIASFLYSPTVVSVGPSTVSQEQPGSSQPPRTGGPPPAIKTREIKYN